MCIFIITFRVTKTNKIIDRLILSIIIDFMRIQRIFYFKVMLWSQNNEYRVSLSRSLTISLTVVCTLWLGFHSPQSHSFFLGPGSGSGTGRAITKSRLSMNEAPGPGAGSARQPLTLATDTLLRVATHCTALALLHFLNGQDSLNGTLHCTHC